MKIKITIDQFCHRKGVKQHLSLDHMPTKKELYEFLGGKDFETINKIMRGIKNEVK